LVVFIAGAVAAVQAQHTLQNVKPSEEERSAVLARQSTIYEQFNVSVTFQRDGRWEEEEYCRAKVESEAGVEEMGKLTFGYGAENQDVQVLMARVIKKDGTIVNAGSDSILDVSEPFAGLGNHYSDYRQKHLLVPGLQPGDIVEYRTKTIEHKPFAPGHFWYSYDFEAEQSCLAEVLKIVVPSGCDIRLRHKPRHAPSIKDENGWITYEWRSSYLPPDDADKKKEKPEKKSNKELKEEARPDVELTTFSNWEEVGAWYRPLQKSRMLATEELRKKTAEVTRNCKTDVEKVQAIYSFVATGIRYVSVSFGMGRFVPHPPAQVLNHLYGDCKDKHTLLATMLQIAGLEACPVLTSTYREIDEDQPAPSRFDHVLTLVHVADSEFWLDATAETAPFRVLSPTLPKKSALVVHLDGPSLLTKVPSDPPCDFFQTLDVDGTLSENGTMTGKVSYTVRGAEEIWLRASFRARPPSDWKKVADIVHRGLSLPGGVTVVQASDPLDTREAFKLSYEFSGLLAISEKDGSKDIAVALPLARLSVPWAVVDDAPDPEPIDLGYPVRRSGRLRLQLPQRFIEQAPLPVSVKRDYAEYVSKYELNGDTLVAERRLEIRVPEIDGKRGPEHVSFQRAVTADGAQQLIPTDDFLKRRLIGEKKDRDSLFSSGMKAFDNRDYPTAIRLLKQVVEIEPDHRHAWNNLGRCYSALGQWETAIPLLQRQIAINPYDEYSYNNLGWAYANLSRYPEAEEAYRRQIEITPLDQYAHKNLGFVMVEQEKYQEALPELQKALTISPADLALQLQIGSALFHLGQHEQGFQTFEKVLQAAPGPPFWNNVGYVLAEFGFRLDLAERYAESAVQGMRTALLNIPTTGKFCCPQVVDSMSAYWDTLGFVYMKKDDLARAEKYVSAGWELGQKGECGQHLGEIYLQQGDQQRAIRQFARSLAAHKPPAGLRKKLADLVGAGEVDRLVAAAGKELIEMRTVEIEPQRKEDGKAEFLLTLSSTSAAEAKFLSGTAGLRAYEEHLKKAKFPFRTPDDQPIRIIRRGELTCSSAEGKCRLVLELPRNVRSLEPTPTESEEHLAPADATALGR